MPTPGYSGDGDGGSELDWIIAGFRACARETLRFLIEQERLPGTDPMVLGLWRHLVLQELAMDVDSVLSQQAAEGEPAVPEPPDDAPFGFPGQQDEATRQMRDQLPNEEQQSSNPQSHLAAVVPDVNSDHSAGRTPPTAELDAREQDC